MDNYQTVPCEDRKQAQLALEAESLALGIDRYQAAMAAGEDTMVPGQRLIKAAVLPLSGVIQQMVDEALAGKAGRAAGISKFLAQFEPERAAFITARCVIHAITEKVLLSTAAIKVAESTGLIEILKVWDHGPPSDAPAERGAGSRLRGAPGRPTAQGGDTVKYLLIAVYLAHGGATPRYEERGYSDKKDCQAMASRYVGQVISGQARAFCLPLLKK